MFCLNNGVVAAVGLCFVSIMACMVAAVGLCFVSIMVWWQRWDCVLSQ